MVEGMDHRRGLRVVAVAATETPTRAPVKGQAAEEEKAVAKGATERESIRRFQKSF
jgi:hypothetical protein